MRQRVAEAFPPGEFIREEMEERGWSQLDLASILGRDTRVVNEILTGKRAITTETAQGLAEAFGTDAQLWMNLQTSYDLWRSHNRDEAVSRRAKLFSLAPIRDLVKRGWIEQSESIDVLEKRVCDFLSLKSVDDDLRFSFAAKTSLSTTTSAQIAWLYRASQLARSTDADLFSEKRLTACIAELRRLMGDAEEARHIPKVLAAAGIRFVVVEPLPRTRIDGACFWLDPNSPVIALSLRFDRIDSFWHALGHELGHVSRRDAASLDVDLDEEQKEEAEIEANLFAADLLIPDRQLDGFIARVSPLYSHVKIQGFAARMGVHPGIVVGQLQHRKEINYSHSRRFLAPIRKHIVQSGALTDGWGNILPSDI